MIDRYLIRTTLAVALLWLANTQNLRGADDPASQLNALLEESWQYSLAEDPLFATHAGDARYNDRLPRETLADQARRNEHERETLKRLEATARGATSLEDRAKHLSELDRIESAVDDIPIPLAFSDKLYELRQHIEVVRRRLTGQTQGPAPVLAAE